MRAFTRLYTDLDETTATNEKVAALVRYFTAAPASDAAWALHFLSGRRPKRLLPAALVRQWAAEAAGISEWLFDESYHQVGDLAETIALLLPAGVAGSAEPLAYWVEYLLALRGLPPAETHARVLTAWNELGPRQGFVWNKLLTGAFRVGAGQRLVIRALAQVSGLAEEVIAHRLMGAWEPTPGFYAGLIHPDTSDTDRSRPYPFFLAYPLEEPPSTLGPLEQWQVEWKWDGIRAQLVRRGGATFLWSRGEELLAGRFPELEQASALLPDGLVLDGEILCWRGDRPLGFAVLQRRIMRKAVTARILAEAPVALVAYDLLEHGGVDVRARPLAWRRSMLESVLHTATGGGRFRLSPLIRAASWEEVEDVRLRSRAVEAEGLMLKRSSSAYGTGRRRGDWWKWKVAPYTVDAVLLYAQAGHGRRAGQFTDYTFGVWDGEQLVPFAKAYSGLTNEEIRRVDAFVRTNTIDRFGPVRTVAPKLVFELAFEAIQRSTRHKSGVAVRFPRMARWRTDKRPEDADTLATVRALLAAAEGPV